MSCWEALGESDDWWTPKHIFDALECSFDLDVAAPEQGPLHVPAGEWFFHDGLGEPWFGFVWMNPPFGGRNALAPWLDRFFDHGNGVALTPDRTSASWFRSAWQRADLVMFLPKVRFLRPDGSEGKSPSTGTALWAAGTLGCRALRVAAGKGLGILAIPHAPAPLAIAV
jgi:hypothetical protein